MYHLMLPIKRQQAESERTMAESIGLSRGALREVLSFTLRPRLSSIKKIADHLGLGLNIMAVPENQVDSEVSTVGISYAVLRDGFESWKIHFMNLVDEFRRNPDPRLILLPPPKELDPKLKALLASIACALSAEVSMPPPEWVVVDNFLPIPWFPSEMESLKAMNILESPQAFRKNNIFVGKNFLERA